MLHKLCGRRFGRVRQINDDAAFLQGLKGWEVARRRGASRELRIDQRFPRRPLIIAPH
jgi:hypothetical protein